MGVFIADTLREGGFFIGAWFHELYIGGSIINYLLVAVSQTSIRES